MSVPVTTAKPFLKWAGGKGQLLQKFQELYPAKLKAGKINNFYEPFLGSGAVFFDITQRFEIKAAHLYDINEDLILAYKVVQQNVSKLIVHLLKHEKAYLKLDSEKRTAYFYNQRAAYNKQKLNFDYDKYSDNWITRVAKLIFLNKTCFNGLFRVNAKGEFNTPVGDYKNPAICDETNLLAVSKVLGIATIKKADFRQIKKDIKKNSFVYFDPPYRPISKTASFTAYSKHSFADEEQTELRDLFQWINSKGEYAMLSNSDPRNHQPGDIFFDELYKKFNVIRIPARRMINSVGSKRGSINEIVVTNY